MRPFLRATWVPLLLLAVIANRSGVRAAENLLIRVPFDFRAGETHFGPGDYVFALDGAARGSVTIRRAADGRTAVVAVRKSTVVGSKTMPTIDFRAYGDSRFLSAIESQSGARWDIAPPADEATLTRFYGKAKFTSLRAETLDKGNP